MLVSYRNSLNVLETVIKAEKLVEVRGNYDSVRKAALRVEEHDLTPFDALNLTKSKGDPIVSSDKDFDRFTERIKLEDY